MEAQLTGEKGIYDCPIRVLFFGPSDPASRARIEKALKADKLVKATQLNQTRKEAEAKRLAMGLKAGSSSQGVGSEQNEPDQAEVTLEDLMKSSDATEFRQGGDAIKTLAIDEDHLAKMPMATQPPELKATLLPYQLQVSFPPRQSKPNDVLRMIRVWPG